MRLLLSLDGDRRIGVHARQAAGFRAACRGDHEGVVRLQLSLDGDRRIDVHAGAEGAFRCAGRGGHEGILQPLLSLPPERGFAWDTQQQHALLMDCLQRARSRNSTLNISAALLRYAPLRPCCLQLLVASQQTPGGDFLAELPDVGVRDSAVVQ